MPRRVPGICTVYILQIKECYPDVELLLFLSEMDGLNSTFANGSRLVDLRELQLKRHILDPKIRGIGGP